MKSDSNRTAMLMLVFACFFWAGNALVARSVVNETGPLALAFFRWLLALLIVLPFARGIWKKSSSLLQHWPMLLLLSLVSIVGYNTFLYLAALTSSALNIGLISASMPLLTLLLARLILQQATSRLQWLSVLLACAGVVWIVCQGSWQQLLAFQFSNGDLWMLLAALDWSLYSVLLRKYQQPLQQLGLSVTELLAVLLMIGVPLLLPLWIWEQTAFNYVGLVNQQGLMALLYVAVFPSLLAYIFWIKGVASLGPAMSVMFIPLIPLFAAIGGWLWLDEFLSSWHWIGGGMILLGLFSSKKNN
ncbi:DMT family transporter [Pelagibaculum spongiae]|uniref:EamA family transporter n=1 Tax=Pelagibaculum spongiae TaxID=2080658 RepID=A0A2V1GRP3_9GAMM|nr:DMT family transporter [Pelagibaculum spongiae]PVZ67671.1 EamA family transporter [Pelagibaculum spongiae]